jgi:hypothetical protein
MVGNIPTDTEKTILKDLVDRSRAAVPGCKVRFVRRVQEPGEQGLLLGLQLPSEIRTNSTEIFKLQDICELQSRDCNLPIGLTVSQQPNKNGLLDLEFLPSEVVAPPEAQNDDKNDPQTIIVSAAIIILLVLAGYLLFKPKSDVQMANENNQVSPKVQPAQQDVIAQPPESPKNLPSIPTPQQVNSINQPIADLSPTKSHFPSKEEASISLPGAAHKDQDWWSKDTPSKDQVLPGIETWNSHLPPRIEIFKGPPLSQTTQVVGEQLSAQVNGSSSRKNSLDELNKYESWLRSNGRIEEADRVEKMILDLP